MAKFLEFAWKSRENGQNLDFPAKQISYGQKTAKLSWLETCIISQPNGILYGHISRILPENRPDGNPGGQAHRTHSGRVSHCT